MELSSLVSAFRNKAISPNLDDFQDRAIDLCGTGGDKAGSFNISTFVSFIWQPEVSPSLSTAIVR